MTGHRNIIRSHYIPRIEKYTQSHEILDWESREAQECRFEVLLQYCSLEGKKILDVGCGLGDLFGYVKRAGIICDYTGIDLLGEMVDLAQEKYDDGHFIHGDMFEQRIFPANCFDVVYTSGIFNLNIGNNEEFLKSAIKRLWEVSRQTVVFNMLHEKSECKEDSYCYHDPEEIAGFLHKFGYDPLIIEDYLGNDFTVFCSVT